MRASATSLSILISVLALSTASATARDNARHHHDHEAIARRLNSNLRLEQRAGSIYMNMEDKHRFEERQLVSIGTPDEEDSTTRGVATSAVPVTSSAVVPSTTSAAATSTSAAPVVTTARTTPAQASPVTTSAAAPVTSAAPVTTSAAGVSSSVAVTSDAAMTQVSQTRDTQTTQAGSVSSASVVVTTGTSNVISSGASSLAPGLTSATHTSTDAQGSVIYVTQVETLSAASSGTNPSGTSYATVLETASSGSSNGTSTAAKDEKDSSPLSTGAIVGISVVGGVGVLGLILFIIWKMKQKRFASFDDDDADGIKWPELNRHGESSMNLPLPAKPTGGHGFETNAMERSRIDLAEDDYDDYSNYPVSQAHSLHDATPYYHDQSPPVPGTSMSYADTGVYGPGGAGVTRNPSSGAATFLSGKSDGADLDRNRSLGGTRAFDMQPDAEMVEMTETKNGALNRSGSGRLL